MLQLACLLARSRGYCGGQGAERPPSCHRVSKFSAKAVDQKQIHVCLIRKPLFLRIPQFSSKLSSHEKHVYSTNSRLLLKYSTNLAFCPPPAPKARDRSTIIRGEGVEDIWEGNQNSARSEGRGRKEKAFERKGKTFLLKCPKRGQKSK